MTSIDKKNQAFGQVEKKGSMLALLRACKGHLDHT